MMLLLGFTQFFDMWAISDKVIQQDERSYAYIAVDSISLER